MKYRVFMLAASAWPMIGAAQQPFDRRVDADPNGEVEIVNTAGEVRVEGWTESAVHVTGELSEDVERVDVTTEAQRVVVRVIMKDDGGRHRNGGEGAALRVRAPQGSRLSVTAVSADVEVSAVRGEQRLESVSGDVAAEAYEAEIWAQSISGDVAIDGRAAAGRIRASAVSGDVIIDNPGGEVAAEAVSGDVAVRSGVITRLEAETVSGDILVTAALSDATRLEARAVSGDVDLQLAGDGAAEYRLSSFSGNVETCFGQTAQRAPQPGPPSQSLRFRQGDSQARVEASTHSGEISVCAGER